MQHAQYFNQLCETYKVRASTICTMHTNKHSDPGTHTHHTHTHMHTHMHSDIHTQTDTHTDTQDSHTLDIHSARLSRVT